MSERLKVFLSYLNDQSLKNAQETLRHLSPETVAGILGVSDLDSCGLYDDLAMELDSLVEVG